MNKKKREADIRHAVCWNGKLKDALDRFVKQVNTPEKVDETIGYLTYRSSTSYSMASEFLRILGEEMKMSYMHRSGGITGPLSDLCLLLGSPDNCRIVCCAFANTLDGNVSFISERDSSNSEWHWIISARLIISKLIDGIVAAKIHEEEFEKTEEVAK